MIISLFVSGAGWLDAGHIKRPKADCKQDDCGVEKYYGLRQERICGLRGAVIALAVLTQCVKVRQSELSGLSRREQGIVANAEKRI